MVFQIMIIGDDYGQADYDDHCCLWYFLKLSPWKLALFNLFLCLQPTMNGSQEDSVEVEEAALAELERELEQRWGESWQIALYILFVS